MSLCINPSCPNPDHPQNGNKQFCQSCGSDLNVGGQYQVMRLLNDNGGFGKIYEASEQGTPKILKVLKEHLNNNPKAVKLFQQEAAVLKHLHFPGIPKVDRYFRYRTKNGLLLHCIVMEKIDGPDLEEWLQQPGNHPLSEKQAIAWLKQLAKTLDLVHGKQWFHQDIKPQNIMLTNSGKLVLIDFGTAQETKYTYVAIGAENRLTAVVSTGYTPPEQANRQAVPQSDFFALGRTFVHLLTGKHPVEFYDVHNDVLDWRQAATISPLLADFLDGLMAWTPRERPLNTQMLLQQIGELERKLGKRQNNNLLIAVAFAMLVILRIGFGYSESKVAQIPDSQPDSNKCLRKSPSNQNPHRAFRRDSFRCHQPGREDFGQWQ